MKIITKFKKLATVNDRFDLIAIESQLTATNLIDCSKIIEKRTKMRFKKEFGKIPLEKLYWYSSINGNYYEALVIVYTS